MTITAHGKRYTETEANQMLAELAEIDTRVGASDGRVTLANAIREALAKSAEADRAHAHLGHIQRECAKAQAELASMHFWGNRNVPADHRIAYDDNGHRKVIRFTTEDGFLKALVRFYSNPGRYDVVHVD